MEELLIDNLHKEEKWLGTFCDIQYRKLSMLGELAIDRTLKQYPGLKSYF